MRALLANGLVPQLAQPSFNISEAIRHRQHASSATPAARVVRYPPARDDSPLFFGFQEITMAELAQRTLKVHKDIGA
jgi:hypothetical protein